MASRHHSSLARAQTSSIAPRLTSWSSTTLGAGAGPKALAGQRTLGAQGKSDRCSFGASGTGSAFPSGSRSD